MRAVAQDTEASAMMGINVEPDDLGHVRASPARWPAPPAIVYLLQFNMRFDTGFELGLIAFTAAVLGGIGNLTGAVLGALVIGFIQAFNEGLTWYTPGSDWTPLDRLRDPDPDPRLPPGGPAGRAHAGGCLMADRLRNRGPGHRRTSGAVRRCRSSASC